MAPSQMALRSPVYHFYYGHLHFHISYLHFLCRYKSAALWLIRPLCRGRNGLSDEARGDDDGSTVRFWGVVFICLNYYFFILTILYENIRSITMYQHFELVIKHPEKCCLYFFQLAWFTCTPLLPFWHKWLFHLSFTTNTASQLNLHQQEPSLREPFFIIKPLKWIEECDFSTFCCVCETNIPHSTFLQLTDTLIFHAL